MMTFLRKHRHWLMIVIAILAIPFVFYFVQKPDYGAMHGGVFAKIYDRTVTEIEAKRYGRLFFVAQALGMDQLVHGLSGGAQGNEGATAFAINLVILRHEAERLGIESTAPEKVEFIKSLRGFHGPNGYDPKKYQEFAENILPANGFTDAQIEELATDAISLNRVKDLVAVGVVVPETESKEEFERDYGTLTSQVIRVRAADFVKEVKVTDDDIKKYFDAHKNELKTDEKRKIEFVGLTLTDEQKKLPQKERVDALQKLTDRANAFTTAMGETGADFQQVAAKVQLPVKTTGEFTAAEPDPQIKSEPQVVAMAFQLSQADPSSEAIETPDGFFVVRLLSVVPARPLALEEAKGKITELLKTSRAAEMATNKGRQAVQQLRETLEQKAPLKFALEKANVKAEPVPPFSVAEIFESQDPTNMKDRPPDFYAIRNVAAQLQPGDVSDFVPWEDGGLIVYLEKRDSPAEAKFGEQRATFEERMLRAKREIVFQSWLREKQTEAGLMAGSEDQPAQAPPPRQKS
jgi:peptidyl-prolyl cis-trans isomerase D